MTQKAIREVLMLACVFQDWTNQDLELQQSTI